MELTIQQLSKKRKKWVEANRENGFEDGIRRLLTDLYPDNAHFIYELLQNAEDAGASQVTFVLNEDSVKFEHNGDRLFSIKDVESITSIGVSAKKDDPTSIGKFGVGFKAVFAYTNTPEIHSGEFNFRIRDLVVPETENLETSSSEEILTRFVFPFNNPKKSKENARKEIERNLRQLGENTLLFLRNIRKIEYLLPNSATGYLERIEHGQNKIEIIVRHPESVNLTSGDYLRFEKTVDVLDDDGKPKSCRIAVAFSIVKNEVQDEEKPDKRIKKKRDAHWEIKPLERGQVSIYFPADKETSNLLFHIHAPFASTIGRDSVRDCSANNELRDHLADLIAESMVIIRDQGLMTVGFLAILPNNKDNLSSFYKPILYSLFEAFQKGKLTPMKQGGYSAANGIFRGAAQLSNLINDDDLATILGEHYSPPIWVANPPQRNQREDNFLSMLRISEWTTEDLISALSAQSKSTMKWLAEKTDEWHQQLYGLLGDYLSNAPSYRDPLNRKDKILRLRIVRVSNGTYNIGCNCYFPSDEVEHDDLMPRVAKGVYSSGKNKQQQEKARKFLEDIGIREVGEAEQVEAILENRYLLTDNALKPNIKDIKRFIAFVDNNPSRAGLFRDYFIFKQTDEKWGKPSDVYIDSPFHNTGLTLYYDALGDKSQCKALSNDYKKCGVDPNKIYEFAKNLGVICDLPISKTSCNLNPERNYLFSDPGGRGFISDIDYTVKGLDKLLETPNVELTRLVWQTINSSDKKCLQAAYRKSHKGNFRYAHSQLVHILRKAAWVPQKNGEFVKPCDAFRDQLPKGFPFDEGQKWLEAIEFGTSAKKKSDDQNRQALEIGFSSVDEAEKMVELARLCRQQGKSVDDLITQLTPYRDNTKPSFPKRAVINLERRQERLADQLVSAPNKEYEERKRNIRTTRGAVDPTLWLRNQYTNENGEMVCQICTDKMPFRKRDGEYYYEAVEALSKDYFNKEHEAQFLALCPVCAAMYKEFVKPDPAAMQSLCDTLKNSHDPVVSLKLGELKTSIQFVESHWLDIKTILLNPMIDSD